MTIGKKLQARRKELNLTQGEVADKLYVSRQAVSNWELDKNYPDLETVIALSDIYQLSLDILLKEDKTVVKGIKRSMNRKLLGNIFYMMTAMGILICLLIDFLLNRSLTWSLIVLTSILAGDVLCFLLSKIKVWAPGRLLGGITLLVPVFLWLLEKVLLHSNYIQRPFYLEMALPTSVVWLVIIWVTVMIQLKMKWGICYSLSVFSFLAIGGNLLTNMIVRSNPFWLNTVANTAGCIFLAVLFFFVGNHIAKTKLDNI